MKIVRRALLGAVVFSAFAGAGRAQVKVERGLHLDADGAVRISNLVGSVRVTGWDRDSVALRGSLPKGDKLFMGGGPRGMKMFIEPLNDRNPQASNIEVMVPARAEGMGEDGDRRHRRPELPESSISTSSEEGFVCRESRRSSTPRRSTATSR